MKGDDRNCFHTLGSWVNIGDTGYMYFAHFDISFLEKSITHTHTMQTDCTLGKLFDTIFEEILTDPTFMV